MDNLEEMDKVIETYTLMSMNSDKIGNSNRTITSKEIEHAIKNFQQISQGPVITTVQREQAEKREEVKSEGMEMRARCNLNSL